MNFDETMLLSKYGSKKSLLAVTMLIQAAVAARLAFSRYGQSHERLKDNPPTMVMYLLADARFFCEACGWVALAVRRLRHEQTPEIANYLQQNARHIDSLYELRKSVNHHYNEDLADEYRTGNYKRGRHQEKLAFYFSPQDDGITFRIGTIEVNMISQLASIQKLEGDLLAVG
ncbi:MAG TPA: hypothetical protein VLE73_00030 [Candidatus Saccharimonadales bacterium]|nr:hypothetical protein [Candidatus Saccharimonadales bacterium]